MITQSFQISPPRSIDPATMDTLVKGMVPAVASITYYSVNGLTNMIDVESASALSGGDVALVTSTIEEYSLTHPNLERIVYPPFYVATGNATPTVMFQKDLSTFKTLGILCYLQAITANGLVKRWRVDFTVKRGAGGALQVGTTTVLALHADTGMTTTGEYVVALTAAGNGVTITVTGSPNSGGTAAHQPVQWSALADIIRYSP